MDRPERSKGHWVMENVCNSHEYPEKMHRSCGAFICLNCGHHDKLARCFCGWALDGGNGRRQLEDMGETIDEPGYEYDVGQSYKANY